MGALLIALLLVALAPPATAAAVAVAVEAPAFAWFTPNHGPPGTQVKIGGYRFTGATHVRFNGVDASFTVTSSQTITTTVPAVATSGPISVSTPSGTATTISSFVVTVPPPAFSWFAPKTGSPGATIGIGGANFVDVTAVRFNGVPAASFAVTTRTALTAVVPANATTGPITVVTKTGSATTHGVFTVIPATLPAAPIGVWFSPATTAGDAITLNWQPPIGASPAITGYKIHRDGISSTGSPPWTAVLSSAARSVRVEHLKAGTGYTITVQAINAVGQGTATTVRYQPAVSTAIYAIDSQQRVVSISSSGTITPFSAGIPGATQVRPDHQGNVVVAGGNKIVRYNIAAGTSTVVATGAAATSFQLDNAGNVYVGGIQYDAITGQATTLPVGDYSLVAANGDLYKISNYDINRYSLAHPAAELIHHDYYPLPPGPDSNGFVPPVPLTSDPIGGAHFQTRYASFTVTAYYWHKATPGSDHTVTIAGDGVPKVLGFNATGNTYIARQKRWCISDPEFCDASALVGVSDPNGAALATVSLDGLTIDAPIAVPGKVDLGQLLVDGAGSIYAVTAANTLMKFPPAGGAGQTLVAGTLTSVSIAG